MSEREPVSKNGDMDHGAEDESVHDLIKMPNLYLKKRKKIGRSCCVCGEFRRQALKKPRWITYESFCSLRTSSCPWCLLLLNIIKKHWSFDIPYDTEVFPHIFADIEIIFRIDETGDLRVESKGMYHGNGSLRFASYLYADPGEASLPSSCSACGQNAGR